MLQDGLYELHYRPAGGMAGDDGDSLLLAMRNGKLLGSDRWGGVLLGHCIFDAQSQKHQFRVRLQVPPGGHLVTDSLPRPDGAIIAIDADFDDAALSRYGVVDVGGQPVRIELMFKGPVPN